MEIGPRAGPPAARSDGRSAAGACSPWRPLGRGQRCGVQGSLEQDSDGFLYKLNPAGETCGADDPTLAEAGLDFSMMAPLPHDQQRPDALGSQLTDLLGIAPGTEPCLDVAIANPVEGLGGLKMKASPSNSFAPAAWMVICCGE